MYPMEVEMVIGYIYIHPTHWWAREILVGILQTSENRTLQSPLDYWQSPYQMHPLRSWIGHHCMLTNVSPDQNCSSQEEKAFVSLN